jgi:hypothetical protein
LASTKSVFNNGGFDADAEIAVERLQQDRLRSVAFTMRFVDRCRGCRYE